VEINDIWERVTQMPARPVALQYLLFAIVVGGGAGTWVTYALHQSGKVKDTDLLISVVTYVLAIVVGCVGDAVLEGGQRFANMTTLVLAVIAVYPSLSSLYSVFVDKAELKEVTGWRLLEWISVSWIVWLYANVMDPKFARRDDYRAAAGGHPMRGDI
jgi:hypothetical protein